MGLHFDRAEQAKLRKKRGEKYCIYVLIFCFFNVASIEQFSFFVFLMLLHSNKIRYAFTLHKRHFSKFLGDVGRCVGDVYPTQKKYLHDSETKYFEPWAMWVSKSSKKHF